ncbi:MAG: hypothetical protein J6J79_10110 [Lachnospiraceae bacterium]|nr:hypothetical protein [Lachnospiraceae bacterium]
MKRYFDRFILVQLLQSFFTTWALMKVAHMEPGNVFTAVFFLSVFVLYGAIKRRVNTRDICTVKKTKTVAVALSVMFAFFYMVVDYVYYIKTLTNLMFQLIILTVVSVGLITLFYYLILLLFSFVAGDVEFARFWYREKTECFYDRYAGLVSFLICIVCWLPYFLYLFPGVMTPDSIVQFEQVLGLREYSNHHPIAHTLLIKFFYNIGTIFTTNRTIAISVYTLFQMCFMAGVVSYFIKMLAAYRIRILVRVIVTLFYALVPYHAVYSVTIWKDILFAGAVLLFGCSLLRLSKKIAVSDCLIFGLSGIMVCLFRSNGWYGFVLCVPFLFFHFRKKAKAMFPVLLTILATAIVVKYPIMNRAGVVQPDFIESLSIPTQQIAHVICNDRELTEEQLDLLEKVIEVEHVKELYVPTISDNMKELVRAGNQDYLVQHKGDFLKLWIELGCKYPWDYLEAYVNQTYGFFYPDSFYLVAEAEGVSGSRLGVSHTPLIRGPLVVKVKEISIKLGSMVPIYSLLWSMGVVFWTLLFCIGCVLVRNEKAKLIYYLPSLALYLTVMIATPVATEFRYVYFMIFSLPFYLLAVVLQEPDTVKEKLPEESS